jgi:hypothetical protein
MSREQSPAPDQVYDMFATAIVESVIKRDREAVAAAASSTRPIRISIQIPPHAGFLCDENGAYALVRDQSGEFPDEEFVLDLRKLERHVGRQLAADLPMPPEVWLNRVPDAPGIDLERWFNSPSGG